MRKINKSQTKSINFVKTSTIFNYYQNKKGKVKDRKEVDPLKDINFFRINKENQIFIQNRKKKGKKYKNKEALYQTNMKSIISQRKIL